MSQSPESRINPEVRKGLGRVILGVAVTVGREYRNQRSTIQVQQSEAEEIEQEPLTPPSETEIVRTPGIVRRTLNAVTSPIKREAQIAGKMRKSGLLIAGGKGVAIGALEHVAEKIKEKIEGK